MIKLGDRVRVVNDQFYIHDEDAPKLGDTGTVTWADRVGEVCEVAFGNKLCYISFLALEKIDEPVTGIKDSGDRTQFSTGAVRDMHTGKGRMDLLPWHAIGEVSQHCENGAIKYGEHNVDRGIPAHSLVDSGLRHMRKFICGETDEDHLLAAVWNFMWLLEMRTTHPELMDIPWRPNE